MTLRNGHFMRNVKQNKKQLAFSVSAIFLSDFLRVKQKFEILLFSTIFLLKKTNRSSTSQNKTLFFLSFLYKKNQKKNKSKLPK